jgi:hypothetical protein
MEIWRDDMKMFYKLPRRGAALLLAGVVSIAGACDGVDQLLEVENPERILERELNDPKLADVLVASTVGELQDYFADPFIWRGSMFTDEQVTGINWENTARLNQRIVRYDEGDADFMFSQISEARMMADTTAARLRKLLETPEQDARVALVLAHAGYTYIHLADVMCEATINVGDKLLQPEELYAIAVSKFEDALQVAQAAGREDIGNLARVGLARAHLNLGNNAEVMRYAAQVPQDFVWYVEYSDAQPSEYNTLYYRTHGGNHSLGMHPSFVNGDFGEQGLFAQADPRIQHTPEWSLGHNGLTLLYKPFQPLLYSGFTGTTVAAVCEGVEECDEEAILASGGPKLPEEGTDIALASGIEALHHYYEAAGAAGSGPAGNTLDFVNARRAFGNQEPVSLSGADLMAELREQRARDLFLAGFRLGDLRRWKRQGTGDFFPTGTHANAQWGNYGDATCFPLPLEEYEGNPNINRP